MSEYSPQELGSLRNFYRDSLLDDTLPFWLPKSIDNKFGGYLLMRDRDGSLLDDDKSVWFQGRFSSILSNLYNTYEQRPEWLEGAREGIDFLKKHCFDKDGQMFFMVTRDGRPIRKRRYFFSEAFAVSAFAQFAKASSNDALAQDARDLFKRCTEYANGTRPLLSKFADTRPSNGLGVPMIFLNVAQQLCDTVGCDFAAAQIDTYIAQIADCVDDDLQCVWESTDPNGDMIDHLQERTITPGHAIEGAWFILHEAKRRGGDKELGKLGLKMLDYSWKQGWDKKHGGIIYFRDPTGKPVMEYWHDMKFWWPQNEAIIATLLAYTTSGNPKYAEWHRMIHEYAHKYFHDDKYGEWFGYLHRNGTRSTDMKGNHFKGPFHLPRMQTYCWQHLDSYLANRV
jgi:N-acylglucosamine 2-epimerase